MKNNIISTTFFTLFALLFSALISPSVADTNLKNWLFELRKEALANDISPQLFDESFLDFQPLDEVIELDRKQPEKTLTLEQYLERTVTTSRIERGKSELSANRELLEKVSKKYEVPSEVIVALWGMETSYGENTGNFNMIESLATLAYDGRRSAFFRKELLNALRIMQEEDMSAGSFFGSWAGAFGQCQFMPSSYLSYAVDFDGDGKRDIWYTHGDIFASIANYLSRNGWNSDEGIEEGSNNFSVLLKWNRSRYFATAIGKLVTAIGE